MDSRFRGIGIPLILRTIGCLLRTQSRSGIFHWLTMNSLTSAPKLGYIFLISTGISKRFLFSIQLSFQKDICSPLPSFHIIPKLSSFQLFNMLVQTSEYVDRCLRLRKFVFRRYLAVMVCSAKNFPTTYIGMLYWLPHFCIAQVFLKT